MQQFTVVTLTAVLHIKHCHFCCLNINCTIQQSSTVVTTLTTDLLLLPSMVHKHVHDHSFILHISYNYTKYK